MRCRSAFCRGICKRCLTLTIPPSIRPRPILPPAITPILPPRLLAPAYHPQAIFAVAITAKIALGADNDISAASRFQSAALSFFLRSVCCACDIVRRRCNREGPFPSLLWGCCAQRRY